MEAALEILRQVRAEGGAAEEAYAEYCREDDEYQNDVQAAHGGVTQVAIE